MLGHGAMTNPWAIFRPRYDLIDLQGRQDNQDIFVDPKRKNEPLRALRIYFVFGMRTDHSKNHHALTGNLYLCGFFIPQVQPAGRP